jgi:predicted glycoside hydrolase/deacetylase ChbG (UPF0249 family)
VVTGQRLIVNADDFGQSHGVNRGIVQAREQGIVTSASLMVRWPDAGHAASYATSTGLDLGLHIDLGEWKFQDDEWQPVYERVDLDDHEAVLREVRRQAQDFVDLVGRPPTHVDSHQHVHRRPVVLAAVEEVVGHLGAPLREVDERVHYCGTFYGQTFDGEPLAQHISVDALIALLDKLPEGVTELGCHPGMDVVLNTMYRGEREVELNTLCDPRVRTAIDERGIRLCSFAELP